MLLGEVAPLLVPQLDGLLIAFGIVAACVVAWGILRVLHYFTAATVGGIAGLVGHIPGVGSIVSSPVNAVYHWMNSAFSAAEATVAKPMGHYWHQLARLVTWTYDEIRNHSALIYTLSTLMLGSAFTKVLQTAIAGLHVGVNGIRAEIKALKASLVKPVTAELHKWETWTRTRVHALDHAIDVTIPGEFKGLRTRTKNLEDELQRAWEALKKNEGILAGTAFLGAVAIALDRLGLQYLKCDNTKSNLKTLCHTNPSEFEAMLGLLVGVIAIEDYQQLVKLMQGVEKVTAEGVQTLLKV